MKIKHLFQEDISIRNILFVILIVFIVIIFISLYIYGIEKTSRIAQAFGIGFGSVFAGLAGLTAFLEWYDKIKRAEKYIKELKEKYPRKLLGDNFKIVQREKSNMVYLIDERDHTKRWFEDQEARKDLGFASGDTTGTMSDDQLAKYREENPIVSKKDYL